MTFIHLMQIVNLVVLISRYIAGTLIVKGSD